MGKTLRVLLIGFALLGLPGALLACGWWGPGEVDEATFFSPEILSDPSCTPLFFTPYNRFYYFERDRDLVDLTEVNLDEWDEFFANKIPRKIWSELLYSASLERLDNLIFRLKGKTSNPEMAGDEVFLAYPDRKSLISALYYVGFAKRVEPMAMKGFNSDQWGEMSDSGDQTASEKDFGTVLYGGLKSMDTTTNPFLHQRYAFQILRLYYYHNDIAQCIRFYDEQRAKNFSDTKSVSWRALDYVAGAHYRAKRFAQANYLYSLVYDGYQPLKLSAAWSFRPQEEADWKASLALAKTKREKAVLWQLLGISNDGLRAMKEIYALDPSSDLLPLLLVREVTRVELTTYLTRLAYDTGIPKVEPKELVAFVQKVADKGNGPKPWLWDLAAGHLHALLGNLGDAQRCLDRGEKRGPGTKLVKSQVRISRFLATLQAMKEPDSAMEAKLAIELVWLKQQAPTTRRMDSDEPTSGSPEQNRAAAFFDWAKIRLAGLYRAKGDLLTSLCLSDVAQDPFYLDSANIDKLMDFLAKPKKNAFEAFVTGEYQYGRKELVEVQGLNALYAGDLEKAEKLFNQVGGDTLLADPFEIHNQDNHDRDAGREDHTVYTKAEFVKRLASLLREASASSKRAPVLYFEVANAFYNITYYGNSRVMYGTVGDHFVMMPRIDDCSRAESFYQKAMELSPDREFKAKAAFMLAKCEQNAYYSKDSEKSKGDFIVGKWYKILHDQFSDTKYYEEVINECGYFRSYVEKSAASQGKRKT